MCSIISNYYLTLDHGTGLILQQGRLHYAMNPVFEEQIAIKKQKKMKKITSILLILIATLALNAYGQTDSTRTQGKVTPVKLHIEGMACEFCARGLKNSLEKLDGITIHKIDPKKGFATLSFNQDNIPSDQTLTKTVENAGFKLTKIQRNKENDSGEES